MQIYVTFGQEHAHEINGVLLNKDTIAVIDCDNYGQGRDIAFKLFGNKFCIPYKSTEWKQEWTEYYPHGFVPVKYINQ